MFELEDLGAQNLKGISGPVRAWAALRPSSVEGRFEAMHTSGLTELVGREEELDLLLRRWSKAKSGQGQVVLLSGEPGIGKSRLTAALMQRLSNEPHTRLRYFCSPQHTDSALYPIISQKERAAGFTHDDTAQAKLDKLDALLAQSFTPRQDTALLAEMMSLPNDGRYPALELTAQQRRQKTLEALTAQLEALSRSNPVLMIFEDVHWIDPTSLEVLGQTVDTLRTLRVLLTIAFRPEFEPPWVGRPYVTALTLNRLGEREIAAMIDHVTGNKALPKSIRQDIIERTDGIPLFVEEMTKAVLEADGESEAKSAVATIPAASIGVPASLHASLMARLDRLGPVKEVAQIGAAIGREFSHALLQAVVRRSDAELQSAVDRLVTAGLLFRQGVRPHANYLFKHALVQDAAYGTLLREPRRALHALIAETLESQFAEIAENRPELLARHCTEAGLIEKAASLWGKAGQRSLERSALVESVEQFTRALEQIATLPGTPALRREQIKLHIALMNTLMHVKGYSAPETKTAVERARLLVEQAQALGEPLDDPLLWFSVLYGFWIVSLTAFNGDANRKVAAEFLALAEKQGDSPAHSCSSPHGFFVADDGRHCESRAHLDQAIALYDAAVHRALATQFGLDPGVTVLTYRSWALWVLGYPEAALADADQAVKDARKIGHAATLINALIFSSLPKCSAETTRQQTRSSTNLSRWRTKRALAWKAFGMSMQGCLLALTGKAADAAQIITSGTNALRSTGTTTVEAVALVIFSEGLCRAWPIQ